MCLSSGCGDRVTVDLCAADDNVNGAVRLCTISISSTLYSIWTVVGSHTLERDYWCSCRRAANDDIAVQDENTRFSSFLTSHNVLLLSLSLLAFVWCVGARMFITQSRDLFEASSRRRSYRMPHTQIVSSSASVGADSYVDTPNDSTLATARCTRCLPPSAVPAVLQQLAGGCAIRGW